MKVAAWSQSPDQAVFLEYDACYQETGLEKGGFRGCLPPFTRGDRGGFLASPRPQRRTSHTRSQLEPDPHRSKLVHFHGNDNEFLIFLRIDAKERADLCVRLEEPLPKGRRNKCRMAVLESAAPGSEPRPRGSGPLTKQRAFHFASRPLTDVRGSS